MKIMNKYLCDDGIKRTLIKSNPKTSTFLGDDGFVRVFHTSIARKFGDCGKTNLREWVFVAQRNLLKFIEEYVVEVDGLHGTFFLKLNKDELSLYDEDGEVDGHSNLMWQVMLSPCYNIRPISDKERTDRDELEYGSSESIFENLCLLLESCIDDEDDYYDAIKQLIILFRRT